MNATDTLTRYTGGDYGQRNPGWHAKDSDWKAQQVIGALGAWRPETVCEVGCGAGEILRRLHDQLSPERLVGYEVAPAALELARERATDRLEFRLQDAAECPERFDLMLLMDVVEHVEDPIGFLRALRFKSDRTILHVPLDLSAQSVLRPGRLMRAREQLGHLHFFTPETAVATIEDAGYRVVGTSLTAFTLDLPVQSRKARVARLPRRLLPRALAARLLGGFSLLVTADNDGSDP